MREDRNFSNLGPSTPPEDRAASSILYRTPMPPLERAEDILTYVNSLEHPTEIVTDETVREAARTRNLNGVNGHTHERFFAMREDRDREYRSSMLSGTRPTRTFHCLTTYVKINGVNALALFVVKHFDSSRALAHPLPGCYDGQPASLARR